MRFTYPRFTEGVTLLETLVACTLTTLAFGLVFTFLIPSLRAQVRGASRAELEQVAVLAVNTLERDLKTSAGPGVSLLATTGSRPVTLTVHSLVELTGAEQQWAPELIVYLWSRDSQRLLRGVWPPAPPALSLSLPLVQSRALRLSAGDLNLLAGQPDPPYRVLAREVVDCRVAHAGTGEAVTSPLQLTLRLEREVAPSQTQVFELTRAVALRNSL